MNTTSSLAAPSTVGTRHPVAVRLDRERAQSLKLRLADRITAFAGSMRFVSSVPDSVLNFRRRVAGPPMSECSTRTPNFSRTVRAAAALRRPRESGASGELM